MTTKIATSQDVSKSTNITRDADMVAAVTRWKELKEIENAGKAAEEERKALEAEVIRPGLKGKRSAMINGIVVLKESSDRVNRSIDQGMLKDGWPEAYTATLRETPYTFFTAL